ncbi:MAG: 4Fe-4S dicluster domain-containing protein [Gemmatimonadota bacterium]
MWRSRRRAAALAQAAALLSLPFVTVGGDSAFRFDIPRLTLHVAGASVGIEEFHLVVIAVLLLILVAIGATVVFGRVWCGWLCGQTVIPELAKWAASALPPRFRAAGEKALLLPVSGVVSLSLIAFFLAPPDIAAGLARSRAVLGVFLVQAACLYGMLALAGPRFCRSVCPYSMLQIVLFTPGTLTIAFDRDRAAECLRCDDCVRACPVAIDIKAGDQRECIACAECIDACRLATAPFGIAPFVAYRGGIARRRKEGRP